jgi:hypothetical protein
MSFPKMVGWGAGKRSDDRATASAGVSPRTGPGAAARTGQIALAPLPTQPGLGLLTARFDECRVEVAVFTHGIDTTGPVDRCLFLVSGCAFRCVEGGGGQCSNRVYLNRLGVACSTLGTTTCNTPSSVEASMASGCTCRGSVIERRNSR